MNDEQLIWEAYSNSSKKPKRNKAQQREFSMEVEAVYNLRGEEYKAWSRKADTLDPYSPEYEHHMEIEKDVAWQRNHWREKIEPIHRGVEEEWDKGRERDENICQLYWSVENNLRDEGYENDAPCYYQMLYRGLESNLANSEYATPEVRAWYAKFGVVG
jgi:hypothetical protein